MIKSSAYRTRFTFVGVVEPIVHFAQPVGGMVGEQLLYLIQAIFARIGEIMPPWGVPASVETAHPEIQMAFRNCFKIDLSMGMLSISH